MKKAKLLLLVLAPLVCLGIITTIPSQGTHGADEQTTTETVMRDKNNNIVEPEETTASEGTSESIATTSEDDVEEPVDSVDTEDTSTPEETGEVVIYDKNGNVVQPITITEPTIEPRATVQPTKLKTLTKGQSYLSNAFSGAGMRYGGYIFGLKSTKNAEITVSKSGFTGYVVSTPDPTHIKQIFSFTPSGSPYTAKPLSGYIYFGVKDPIDGSTYALKAI